MLRTKRSVRELRMRAINSLVLSIELFNRPQENARAEAVIMMIHHAFEMLLKAVLVDRDGRVHEKGAKYTYSFEKCLRILENKDLLSPDERRTLVFLDTHRDTMVHYYQDLSEDMLYLQAQAGITLFDDLMSRFFDQRLADHMPDRVLPVSTRPPKDLQLLIDSELSVVDELLRRKSRKGPQAAARLRSVLALAIATRDSSHRVSEWELRRILKLRRLGEDWSILIPDIAQLRLETQGDGIPICLRIKKDASLAVRVAKEGEPVVGTLVKQEVNVWDKYPLGRSDLAKKLGITGPRVGALIVELGIQGKPDCFKLLRRKASKFKGYSKHALDMLREAISNGIDVDAVWAKHKHRFLPRRGNTGKSLTTRTNSSLHEQGEC